MAYSTRNGGNRIAQILSQSVTCLFCKYVTDTAGFTDTETVIQSRNKLLLNLCRQYKLNSNELPAQCRLEQFPFCPTCQGMVEVILQLQEEMDQLAKKLKQLLDAIEKNVVDGMMLTSISPELAAAESKKFVRLPEMIFEARRNRLIEQCNRGFEVDASQPGTEATEYSNEPPASSSITTGEQTSDETDNCEDPIDLLVISSVRGAVSGKELKRGRSAATPLASNVVLDVSTPKRTINMTPRNPVAATPGPSRMGLVDTPSLRLTRSSARASTTPNTTSAEICSRSEYFQPTPGKIRQFFQGVRILNVSSPLNNHFYQCGVCHHTVPIPKKVTPKGQTTPFMRMKMHIQSVHNEMLTNSNPKVEVCDICGRSVTGTNNLPQHMFTHKNVEERTAAVAAGERGAYAVKIHSKRQMSSRSVLRN